MFEFECPAEAAPVVIVLLDVTTGAFFDGTYEIKSAIQSVSVNNFTSFFISVSS